MRMFRVLFAPDNFLVTITVVVVVIWAAFAGYTLVHEGEGVPKQAAAVETQDYRPTITVNPFTGGPVINGIDITTGHLGTQPRP